MIRNNTIAYNEGSSGGGICVFHGYAIQMDGNHIHHNYASGHFGGGIRTSDTLHVTITNNRIEYNESMSNGGGAYLSTCDSTAIINNSFFSNKSGMSGGALSTHRHPGLFIALNNTVVSNQAKQYGGGFYLEFLTVLMSDIIGNCILYSNSAWEGSQIVLCKGSGSNMQLDFDHSCIRGGKNSIFTIKAFDFNWGPHMISDEPKFINQSYGDLHIGYDSPCRDTGCNTFPGLTTLDFEGDPRITGGTVDMGSDEFHTHLYTLGTPSPGSQIRIKIAGTPGSAPLFLWAGSGMLPSPMKTPYGNWYLEMPLIFELGFGLMTPPNGVKSIPYTIPLTAPITNIPLQAMLGMELTNPVFLEMVE